MNLPTISILKQCCTLKVCRNHFRVVIWLCCVPKQAWWWSHVKLYFTSHAVFLPSFSQRICKHTHIRFSVSHMTEDFSMKCAQIWLNSRTRSWPVRWLGCLGCGNIHLDFQEIDSLPVHRFLSSLPSLFGSVDYRGNFDTYVKLKHEKMKNAMREYQAYQSKREHMMEFIDKFRANAKRATMVRKASFVAGQTLRIHSCLMLPLLWCACP